MSCHIGISLENPLGYCQDHSKGVCCPIALGVATQQA
jgi:hypothetical protein